VRLGLTIRDLSKMASTETTVGQVKGGAVEEKAETSRQRMSDMPSDDGS
jgi:hypothetical protein